MKRAALHLINELCLLCYMKRRYWFESVLGLAFLMGLFGALAYAVLTVSGKSLASGELDTMIVGFVLWQFASNSYSSASNDVAEETRHRTIEQLYIVPLPMAALLGLRTAGHLLGSLFVLLLGLFLVGALTEGRLQMHVAQIIGTVLLAAPALVGVGYAVAGLLLLVKKIEIVHGLMYFAIISLVALPAYPVNGFALLPYALAAATVKASATGSVIALPIYAMIALNSAAYLAVGLLAFSVMERRARKLGVLGHW